MGREREGTFLHDREEEKEGGDEEINNKEDKEGVTYSSSRLYIYDDGMRLVLRLMMGQGGGVSHGSWCWLLGGLESSALGRVAACTPSTSTFTTPALLPRSWAVNINNNNNY